ncbi:endocellulase [Infundibulicybe gibba]|nr:endocellulase [Infundibulicybe gibba]
MTHHSFAILAILAITTFAYEQKGPTECRPAAGFSLCQNLWGASAGVGTQSTNLISSAESDQYIGGTSISWSTTYAWENAETKVKSFANAQSSAAKGVKLQDISLIPSVWNWSYETASAGLQANVAYDIWTGFSSAGWPASKKSWYEIMIWISARGKVQPLGQRVAKGIQVAGHTWDLWRGPYKTWQVMSFVTRDGDLTAFNADLNMFLKFLIDHQGLPSHLVIHSLQAGTEPFVGQAKFVTSQYSVAIQKQ